MLTSIDQAAARSGGTVNLPFDLIAEWLSSGMPDQSSRADALNVVRSLIRKKYLKGFLDWEYITYAQVTHDGNVHAKEVPLSQEKTLPENRSIFIVHGHDAHLKEAVARFIERLGFNAIIISEKPSAGRTIIEQVERYSDVQYAVVLLTPDDLPATSSGPTEHARARQNVIFELGFFAGRLGRSRVHCLRKGDTQTFSDIDGVIWTPVDDPGMDWRIRLAQEMSEAGLAVDLNKAFHN